MLTKEKQPTITVERNVGVSPAEVYRAFTNEAALRDWLCNAAEVEARTGGRVYLWWDRGYYSAGVFTALERNKSVVFTWRGPRDPEATEVRVELEQAENGGTHIVLTHSGVGPGDEWSEIAYQDRKGWESALENLQSVLETGVDLRISRRPMFGMSGGGPLTGDLIDRLGVPVTEGLWLGGLVEGLGAHRGGLRKDDVIVSLDGQPVSGFAAFGSLLQTHRAGDKVEVGFYRGAEHKTLTIELSERPRPNLPATHSALVDAMRSLYTQLDGELEAVLEGVTDSETEYHPAPGEWGVKEVLAHLITEEEDTQSWICATIDDADTNAPFFSNQTLRMKAVTSVYSTLPALLQRLKLAEATTIALAELIPEEAQAHRHQHNLLVGWLTGFDTHYREHITEIGELVKAARG